MRHDHRRHAISSAAALLLAACSPAVVAGACPTLPPQMRAAQIAAYGAAETVPVETVAVPVPAANEILVRVLGSSVNPIDWKISEGHARQMLPLQLPATLGVDVAGIVVARGAQAGAWSCGDEIVAYLGLSAEAMGAYAEFVRIRADIVTAKPARLSWPEAGALPLVSLTAWQGLVEQGRIAAGDRVLVHGGAGGVGSAAVQIAKARGATVIATASASSHELVRSLGADEVIDYRAVKFEDAVEDVDLVFDTVGGDVTARSLAVLSKGGRLVTIAGALPAEDCRAREIECRDMLVQPDAADLAAIAALVDGGKLRVHVSDVYPLEEIGTAFEKNKQGSMRGKIAIRIGEHP